MRTRKSNKTKSRTSSSSSKSLSTVGYGLGRFAISNSYIQIVLVGLASFGSSIFNEFVWLDQSEILGAGYRVTSWSDAANVFSQPLDVYQFRSEGEVGTRGGYWRPLYALSISLDWMLWGENPILYHLENVLWHILLGVLLFRFGTALFGEEPSVASPIVWATLLFVANPLGVHSVAWISGRKDILCAVFSLLCLLTLASCIEKRTWGKVVLSPIWLVCALWCKELAVVVPAVACLLVPQVLSSERKKSLTSFVIVGSSLVLTVLGYLLARKSVLGGIGLDISEAAVGGSLFIANACQLVWHYAACVFFPCPIVLSDRWQTSLQWQGVEIGSTLALFVSLAVLLFTLVRSLGRKTSTPTSTPTIRYSQNLIIALGILWFLVWLLPALGFLPLRHVRAERYLYPSSWGLLLALVCFAQLLSARFKFEKYLPFMLSAYLAFFVVRTNVESFHWSEDDRLFTRAVEVDERYREGLIGLGYARIQEGDFSEAYKRFDEAIKLQLAAGEFSYWSPYIAYMNRGRARYELGEQDELGKQDFLQAGSFQPGLAEPYLGAGLCAMRQSDFAGAEAYFRECLARKPGDMKSTGNLALALLNQEKSNAAEQLLMPFFESGADLADNDLQTLGASLLLQGKYVAAETVFRRINEKSPGQPTVLAKLAWCYFALQNYYKAEEYYEEAKSLDPENPTLLFLEREFGAQAIERGSQEKEEE